MLNYVINIISPICPYVGLACKLYVGYSVIRNPIKNFRRIVNIIHIVKRILIK